MRIQKKINSFAYFNKTYINPRPLDIGTFVLKRNFLSVHFSDKLKPLRIGPFKINNKISDITYDMLIKISIHNITDNNNSSTNDSINPFISFSDEEQSVEEEITNFNKETEIPSTIDFQPESFSQYSSFPYKRNKQQSSYTDSENQSNFHDYDNYINP